MKRECGVESAETVCEKIVPLVKLNEEVPLGGVARFGKILMCMEFL